VRYEWAAYNIPVLCSTRACSEREFRRATHTVFAYGRRTRWTGEGNTVIDVVPGTRAKKKKNKSKNNNKRVDGSADNVCRKKKSQKKFQTRSGHGEVRASAVPTPPLLCLRRLRAHARRICKKKIGYRNNGRNVVSRPSVTRVDRDRKNKKKKTEPRRPSARTVCHRYGNAVPVVVSIAVTTLFGPSSYPAKTHRSCASRSTGKYVHGDF
jgi:hypothetical protein